MFLVDGKTKEGKRKDVRVARKKSIETKLFEISSSWMVVTSLLGMDTKSSVTCSSFFLEELFMRYQADSRLFMLGAKQILSLMQCAGWISGFTQGVGCIPAFLYRLLVDSGHIMHDAKQILG